MKALHLGVGQFELNVDAHFQGLGLNPVDGLFARINDVARREGEGETVGLQLGDGVEVFDQLGHAADVVIGLLKEPSDQRFILEIGLNEGQDEPLDVEEGCLEFVGEVADEFLSERVFRFE